MVRHTQNVYVTHALLDDHDHWACAKLVARRNHEVFSANVLFWGKMKPKKFLCIIIVCANLASLEQDENIHNEQWNIQERIWILCISRKWFSIHVWKIEMSREYMGSIWKNASMKDFLMDYDDHIEGKILRMEFYLKV